MKNLLYTFYGFLLISGFFLLVALCAAYPILIVIIVVGLLSWLIGSMFK